MCGVVGQNRGCKKINAGMILWCEGEKGEEEVHVRSVEEEAQLRTRFPKHPEAPGAP